VCRRIDRARSLPEWGDPMAEGALNDGAPFGPRTNATQKGFAQGSVKGRLIDHLGYGDASCRVAAASG